MTEATSLRSRLRRLALLLSVGGWLLLPLPMRTLAQGEVALAHEYTYGQSARFTATLPPGLAITEARFFLRVPRPGLADTEIIVPALGEGQAVVERDLRLKPFPPFAELTYWWTFTDADGNPHQTESVSFLYEDNRFVWQELHEGPFTVRWVAGTPEQMVEALDVAREATQKITAQLRIADPGDILFYIYPSTADLQAALRLTGNEWLAGMTLPEVGVVLLAIPPTEGASAQLQADLPHELTHQLLYRQLGDAGYAALPIWLSEGLASVFEQGADANRMATLQQAQEEGRLLPLADLCEPFYALDTERLRLAYAQSYSAVSYLQGVYGWSGIHALVQAYADGRECSAGMQHALGIGLPTFERQWRAWLAQGGRTTTDGAQRWVAMRLAVRDLAPWLVLAGVLMLPGVLACFHRRGSPPALPG